MLYGIQVRNAECFDEVSIIDHGRGQEV